MNPVFIIEFLLLFILSTWMTSAAVSVLSGKRLEDEEMSNLFEQVLGAVRTGDLPRAILILEGEEGPMVRILSAILTEGTKFTPKLRVAYKITLESLRRRSQVNLNPMKFVSVVAPILGVIGMLVPVLASLSGMQAPWSRAAILLAAGVIIGGISQVCLAMATKNYDRTLAAAETYGRKLLGWLLGNDSPLPELRQKKFPAR